MKSGIELIAIERAEQLEKHGRTVMGDYLENSSLEKPLTKAASALTVELNHGLAKECMRPMEWSQEIWDKMMNKPYKDRLIIAGALIAAEIDRLQFAESLEIGNGAN
jgi:hypothetical protein